jgi:hypothetical protein
MKRIFITILSIIVIFSANAQNNNDAIIFKAMKTELVRSMDSLRMPNMPDPFFINFIIAEGEAVSVTASLGGVITSRHDPVVRSFFSRVMTESNELTNDIAFNNQGTVQNTLAIDNDIDQLRRGIWRAADVDYKRGLAMLTNKKNALRRINLTPAEEALLDYNTAVPVEKIIHANFPVNVNLPELETLCEVLSAQFRNYPELYASNVNLSAFQSVFYNLTSEGTKTKQPLSQVILRAFARVRAADGAVLSDFMEVVVNDLSKLPSKEELIAQVNTFASELQAVGAAQPVTEYYSGPVLFEGDAVADIFLRNLLTPQGLNAYRRPINQQTNIRNIPIGRKLIDTRFTVYNHTQKTEFNGKSLVGAYAVDGEGVVPQASLLLVENGMLRNFLNNRIPTLHASTSNGNQRISANPAFITTDVKPSVLEIQTSEGFSRQELRTKLMSMAKAEGLDYAYIVRKTSGVARIYQIDVNTGAETMMRSPDIEQVGLRQLKRVDAVASDMLVENRMVRHTHSQEGRGAAFPVSIIAPNALLFQDVEINSSTATLETKPVVRNPLQR